MSTDQALLELYFESLANRRGELQRGWDELRTGVGDEATVQRIKNHLHQLAGSAGAYGFAGLGDAARTLELVCADWLGAESAARDDVDRFSRRSQGDFDELDYQLEFVLQRAASA
ncbi:MAG: Hpt domain-containing protein [Rhodanobacteraceae bacterium]|nr:Hpt domain-containing protein [Xanthomonadales bacterium]MCP5477204.1 Hpt domain-containing protein [Rhodanobacteraceae bacterium]HPF74026.1 Hpt domain-containing protein [Xanthomonadaceae bacterium]HRX99764.1 Hpt domain-containing protein [Xanthomonadaceae bacterium]